MNYNISITKKARKFIASQPKNRQEQLLRAIYKLPQGDVKAVTNKKDMYRLRVGDYRVIYTLYMNTLTITVVNVGNRGQIYNDL
ncbi:MAG: type II toxin-antitoxin system RelE/ParE family toxin [Oscillospiraceae bacterium]|nr:type II toxin-antitoxin system RelE/ParE family toxin [Oscillospiraceae bacterium]